MVKFNKLFGSSAQKAMKAKAEQAARLESLQKDHKTQAELIEHNEKELSTKKAALDEKAGQLEALYQQVENRRGLTKDALKTLETRVKEVEKEHSLLEDQVDTLNKRITGLKTDLGKIDKAIEKAGGPTATAVAGDKAHLDPILNAYKEQFGDTHGKPETKNFQNGKSAVLLNFPDKETAMKFFNEQAKAGHKFELLDKDGNVTHRSDGSKLNEVAVKAQVSMRQVGTNTTGARQSVTRPQSKKKVADSATESREPITRSQTKANLPPKEEGDRGPGTGPR